MDFLQPFQVRLDKRNIQLKLDDSKLKQLEDSDLSISDIICTDFAIYESIFFHIFRNAIKYTPSNSLVTIEISFIPFPQYSSNGSDEQE